MQGYYYGMLHLRLLKLGLSPLLVLEETTVQTNSKIQIKNYIYFLLWVNESESNHCESVYCVYFLCLWYTRRWTISKI